MSREQETQKKDITEIQESQDHRETAVAPAPHNKPDRMGKLAKQDMQELRLREYVRQLERKLGLLNEGEMSCCSITLAQCHTLVEIGRSGTLSLNALSELLHLDNSTTSRTVQNLVQRGLVVREPDPLDRRAVVIALTPEGECMFTQIETGMNAQFTGVWKRIPEHKRDQILDSMEILLDAIKGCC